MASPVVQATAVAGPDGRASPGASLHRRRSLPRKPCAF